MADAIRTYSRTLEGQLFELFQAIRNYQDDEDFDEDNTVLIDPTFSADNAEFTASIRIPMEFRLDAQGQWVGKAKPVLNVPPTVIEE
jgi:hypothetical protein